MTMEASNGHQLPLIGRLGTDAILRNFAEMFKTFSVFDNPQAFAQSDFREQAEQFFRAELPAILFSTRRTRNTVAWREALSKLGQEGGEMVEEIRERLNLTDSNPIAQVATSPLVFKSAHKQVALVNRLAQFLEAAYHCLNTGAEIQEDAAQNIENMDRFFQLFHLPPPDRNAQDLNETLNLLKRVLQPPDRGPQR